MPVLPDLTTGAIGVSNVQPRYDVAGAIVDAHDGCLEYFADCYYLYGTAYGDTDGFTTSNHFVCYSSPDLVTWTLHGDILPEHPIGIHYRPYVKYCAATGQYVLWYNWYPSLWDGQFGVATSTQPTGPFTLVTTNVAVAHMQPGDLGLFVDDDGTGYLIYTSIAADHGISIERLAPDYMSSTQTNSGFLSHGDEACSLFKRQGIYYAVFDTCCAFCPHGSGAKVFTATQPLGPYHFQTNINRNATTNNPSIVAQQTHIATLPTQRGPVYIWMGDRWQSTRDGRKGHDFQYWSAPLQFDEWDSILPLRWVNQW